MDYRDALQIVSQLLETQYLDRSIGDWLGAIETPDLGALGKLIGIST